MHINSQNSYERISKEAAQQVVQIMKEHPGGLFCFAGGDTPILTLELLVDEHRRGSINLQDYYYIELDEWVGLGENDQGSCISYLNEYLFIPADIPNSNIHVFNAKADDLTKECVLANAYIKNHEQITLSLLGVGVNGHLGFNEPGVDFNLEAHIVDLKDDTKMIGQKYFVNNFVPSRGITLGIKQLLASKYIILLANGESKKTAIAHLLSDEAPINEWPVTALKEHPNTYAFLDSNLT